MENNNANTDNRKSNPRFKAVPMETDSGLMIGIGEKGGISVYGLQRFPVTLFWEQWKRILTCKDEFEVFALEHAGLLSDGKPAKTTSNGAVADGYKVNAGDIAIVAAEAAKCTAAGDVPGAIKYATLKAVAELTGKVGPADMLEIMQLKVRQ